MTQVQIQAVTLDGSRGWLVDWLTVCGVVLCRSLLCYVVLCLAECVCVFEGVWHIWYTEMNVT